MDLRSYSDTQKSAYEKTAGENKQNQTNPIGNMNEADIRRAVNHFSKMSNDQLMRELGRHLNAKKAQGRQNEILAVIEQVKPFLNDEQKRRLAEIMEKY